MINILKGITKIALSPVKAVSEFVEDVSGKNGDEQQMISLGTMGMSSIVKGLAK